MKKVAHLYGSVGLNDDGITGKIPTNKFRRPPCFGEYFSNDPSIPPALRDLHNKEPSV